MESSYKRYTPPEFKVMGNWNEQTRKLKSKYSQLTDNDLEYKIGKEDDIIRRVQDRLKKNRDEVVNILRNVQSEHMR